MTSIERLSVIRAAQVPFDTKPAPVKKPEAMGGAPSSVTTAIAAPPAPKAAPGATNRPT
jgi:hypothetical protein